MRDDESVIACDEATLHKARRLPSWPAPAPPKGYARDIVESFALSGWDMAEVEAVSAPEQVETAIRQFCHRYPRYGVRQVTRHGRLFLVRADVYRKVVGDG